MPTRRVRLLGAALCVLAALSGCTVSGSAERSLPAPPELTQTPMPQRKPTSTAPNFVFVLTDDLDRELVRHMPQVRAMQRAGANFTNYTVSNSLCCPSRASILTGKFPHNTGVRTNTKPNGGHGVFRKNGLQNSTIGTQLQRAGYRTGFMGKYMNGYNAVERDSSGTAYVPPGWDDWVVTDNGYPNYRYWLNDNGRATKRSRAPTDYLTDVLSSNGQEFILDSTADGKPFYLQVSVFTPHGPATPAPRDRGSARGLRAPRGPSFNEADVRDKPRWLADNKPLRPKVATRIDRFYRKRVQSLRSVDAMLASLRSTLARTGQLGNTYVVFSSDNGFHLGQHRLRGGKQTAFDTDILVPLVLTGPDVPAGRTVREPVQNIDLRPTFGDIAGTRTPSSVDGMSFAPLLRGDRVPWRDAGLIEHVAPGQRGDDPDRQSKASGVPPTYDAIRTRYGTYVQYVGGEREYYDHATDPYQLDNSYSRLSPGYRETLRDTVRRLTDCSGSAECARAARMPRTR